MCEPEGTGSKTGTEWPPFSLRRALRMPAVGSTQDFKAASDGNFRFAGNTGVATILGFNRVRNEAAIDETS